MSILLEPILKDTVIKGLEEINPFEIARKESERVIGNAVENTLHEVPFIGDAIDEKNEIFGAIDEEGTKLKKKVFDKTGITRVEDHLNKNVKETVDKFKDKLGIKKVQTPEEIKKGDISIGTTKALDRLGYEQNPEGFKLNKSLSIKNAKLQRVKSSIDRIENLNKQGALSNEEAKDSLDALFRIKDKVLDGIESEDGKPYHETEFDQEKEFYNNILSKNKDTDKKILSLNKPPAPRGTPERQFSDSIRKQSIRDRMKQIITDTIDDNSIKSLNNPNLKLTSNERSELIKLFDRQKGHSFKLTDEGNLTYNIPESTSSFGKNSLEFRNAVKRGSKMAEIISKSDNISDELKDQLLKLDSNLKPQRGSRGRWFKSTGTEKESIRYQNMRNEIKNQITPDILNDSVDAPFRRSRVDKKFGFGPRNRIFGKPIEPQPDPVLNPEPGLPKTFDEGEAETQTAEPKLPNVPRRRSLPDAPDDPIEPKTVTKKPSDLGVKPKPSSSILLEEEEEETIEEPRQPIPKDEPIKGKGKEGEEEKDIEEKQDSDEDIEGMQFAEPLTEVKPGSGKIGGVGAAVDDDVIPTDEGDSFIEGDPPSDEFSDSDTVDMGKFQNEDGSAKSDADIKRSWKEQYPNLKLTKDGLVAIKDAIKNAGGTRLGQLALGLLGIVTTALLSVALVKLKSVINESEALPADIKEGLSGVIDSVKETLKGLDKTSKDQINKEIKSLGNDILRFGRSSNQRDEQLVNVNNPGSSTTQNKKNRSELDKIETDLKNQRGNIKANAQRLSKDLKAASRKAQRDEIKKEAKEKAKEEKDTQAETAIDKGIVSPRLDPFQFTFNISNDSDNSKFKKKISPQFTDTNQVDNSVKIKRTIGNENKINKSVKGKNNKLVSDGFK